MPVHRSIVLSLSLALPCLFGAALSGCGERGAALPAYILATAPEGAVSIDSIRAHCTSGEMEPGRDVVFTGRVGAPGRAIGAEAAVFTLLDLGVDFCPEGGTCCAEPDEMRARSVTVRVVDGDGQPMLIDLAKSAGLHDGAEVVVRGRISSADANAVVIDAPAIHIVRENRG